MLKNIHVVFQLSKTKLFEVNLFRYGNRPPRINSWCLVFEKNKKDFSMGGQCQEEVLISRYKTARDFYEKWKPYHLGGLSLTDEQYVEIKSDLNSLYEKYNYRYYENFYKNGFSFEELVELSDLEVKKRIRR